MKTVKTLKVRTVDAELARFLFGKEDLESCFDSMNADERRGGVIRARNGDLKVTTHEQLGGDVLQLQRSQLPEINRYSTGHTNLEESMNEEMGTWGSCFVMRRKTW